jgi:regulator of protease activity HflC (stomatin/prohibitin superfamily)
MEAVMSFLAMSGVFLVLVLISGIKILREYERGVVFRLGRLTKEAKGPGIIYVIPVFDKMVKVSLRTIPLEVPAQDVISKDNVSVKVNAVVYFRVVDANKAVTDVQDYLYATSQLAQTTLRSTLGQFELDQLLSERENINEKLQDILDKHTGPWGIKVALVEVKNIDLPDEMKRAIARQAEAERERRAKVIHADGEFQASQKLADAAHILGKEPTAIQLRFLQTLVEVAAENNSTTLFPLPIDLFRPFLEKAAESKK